MWLWILVVPVVVVIYAATESQWRAQAQDETPAAQKPAQAAAAVADPLAVPEIDDPKELLKFIASLGQREVPGANQEEQIANLCAMQRTVLAAAEKILAGEPDGDELLAASEYRLVALRNLARFGDKDADAQFAKIVAALEQDENPKLAKMGHFYALQTKIQSVLEQGTDEETQDLIGEISDLLKATPPEPSTFSLASALAQQLEFSDKIEHAAAAYDQFGKAFAASDSPQFRSLAETYEGSARRLGLLGHPMDLHGQLIDGKPFDASAYKGKVVLVDFWATWCGYCVDEMPNIKANYDRFHEQGFDVVGVNVDEPQARNQVTKFLADREIPWATIFDADAQAAGPDESLADYYGVSMLPSTMLIDRDGKVVAFNVRGEKLTEQLEKLLGKGEATQQAAQ